MMLLSALTCLAVVALLLSDRVGSLRGRWVAKPLASAGFVATALAGGATGSEYGRAMLLGFALCWVGDVLLIPKKNKKAFLAGLGTFLLGHVAFAAAFWIRGSDPLWVGGAFVALLGLGVLILRWLFPYVERAMRGPVVAYMLVISGMVASAAGGASRGHALTLLGAVAFYLSDISVARDQFVSRIFMNRLWGLPLYYGAQLIFAWSVVSG